MMERGKRLQGAARVAAMVAVMVLSGAAIVSMVGTHVTVRAEDATAGKSQVGTSSGQSDGRRDLVSQVSADLSARKQRRPRRLSMEPCILSVVIGNSHGSVEEYESRVGSLRKSFDNRR